MVLVRPGTGDLEKMFKNEALQQRCYLEFLGKSKILVVGDLETLFKNGALQQRCYLQLFEEIQRKTKFLGDLEKMFKNGALQQRCYL